MYKKKYFLPFSFTLLLLVSISLIFLSPNYNSINISDQKNQSTLELLQHPIYYFYQSCFGNVSDYFLTTTHIIDLLQDNTTLWESLSLQFNFLGDANIIRICQAAKKSPRIRKLLYAFNFYFYFIFSLEGNNLTDVGLKGCLSELDQQSNIETLHFDINFISDASIETIVAYLSRHPNLKVLE